MRQAALRMGGLAVFEDIAYSAHGSNQRRLSGTVYLATQTVDVDVDDVGVGLNAHAPHLVEDHGARDDAASVAAQIFEEDELLLGELKDLAGTRGFAAQEIEFKILHAEAGCVVGGGAVALEQISQAGEQLGERERLGEIVVSALLEAADAIVDGAARGEDENRRTDAELAQPEDEGDAILVRQAEVDDEDVEGIVDSEALGGFAVGRGFNFVSGLFKRAAQETLNIDFVFDEQKAHGGILDHLRGFFRGIVQLSLPGSGMKGGRGEDERNFIRALARGHFG